MRYEIYEKIDVVLLIKNKSRACISYDQKSIDNFSELSSM